MRLNLMTLAIGALAIGALGYIFLGWRLPTNPATGTFIRPAAGPTGYETGGADAYSVIDYGSSPAMFESISNIGLTSQRPPG